MPADPMRPFPPRPRARRPRTGGVLGRLLAGLVAIVGLVALVAVVGTSQGWIVIRPGGVPGFGSTVGDTAAGDVDATTGGAPGSALRSPDPVSARAGDSVGLPALAPGRTGAPDTTSGLGIAPGTDAASVPPPTATPDELSELRLRMAVPVPGVAATALHDDFDQARGGGSRRHAAMDILAPRGTPVVAATNGRVVKLFDSQAGGLTIYEADATNRFVMLYGHLDRYETGVREGMDVKQGQILGYVGSTGNASAETPHLHFAVARSADPGRWWGSGTPVNPYPLLKP